MLTPLKHRLPWMLSAGLMFALIQFGCMRAAVDPPDRQMGTAPADVEAARDELAMLMRNRDPAACHAVLQRSGLRYEPVPDRDDRGACGYKAAVRVTGGGTDFNKPFIATCPLALAIDRFEKMALQPAAQRHFGQTVRRLHVSTSYHCRSVGGGGGGRLSEHGRANALDIHGFELSDGRTVWLKEGWQASDERADFLREVHQRGCDLFTVALGPDYNKAHADHFHFDVGRRAWCG